MLASSLDGLHLTEEKILVAGVPDQRNQNPNLFRDPRTGRFYLTFYRGNDKDHFEIISKSADSVVDLDKAPEKILLKSTTTVAAPTLLYLKDAVNASGKKTGVYDLATEVYPHRYTEIPKASGRSRSSPPIRQMAISSPWKAIPLCAASAPVCSSTFLTTGFMAMTVIWKHPIAGCLRKSRRLCRKCRLSRFRHEQSIDEEGDGPCVRIRIGLQAIFYSQYWS